MLMPEREPEDCFSAFGLEYYLATEHLQKEPVFLFWNTPPTLMVGKYQSTLEEIDRDFADAHGITIVRRMSGGGTIYTDRGSWQYTFIVPGSGSIHFSEFLKPILRSLKALGVPAELSGRNDILAGGRKFSGTAQYMTKAATVHHGSLLFETDIDQMVRATTVKDWKMKSKGIKSIHDRVVNLSTFLSGMSGEEFRRRMIEEVCGGDISVLRLTDSDLARIKELGNTHFYSWEARFGRNPACSMIRSGHFAGGTLEMHLETRHGLISEVHITGDFFASVDAETIESVLTGLRLDEGVIAAALRKAGLQDAVRDISPEDIARTAAGTPPEN